MQQNKYLKILGLLLLIVLMIVGCKSNNKSGTKTGSNPGDDSKQGNLKVSMVLPVYRDHSYGSGVSAAAIAPQTYYVRLRFCEDYYYEPEITEDIKVDLTYGTIQDGVWQGNFKVAPYDYDMLTVSLLNSSGNRITEGRAMYVRVMPGQTTPISIGCVPVNPNELSNGEVFPETVLAGRMKFFAFNGIKDGSYEIKINPSSGNPDLYVYDANGTEVEKVLTGGTTQTLNFIPTKSGIYYLGVYSPTESTFVLSFNEKSLPPAELDHLVINEISYSNRLCIEIYNPTNETVDLNGWKLKNKYGSTETINGFLKIPPRCYGVVGDRPDGIDISKLRYFTIDWFWGFIGEADSLALLTPTDVEVDYVMLGTIDILPPVTSWDTSQGKLIRGTYSSVARKVPLQDNNNASDWNTTYGTLGLINNATGSEDVWGWID